MLLAVLSVLCLIEDHDDFKTAFKEVRVQKWGWPQCAIFVRKGGEGETEI